MKLINKLSTIKNNIKNNVQNAKIKHLQNKLNGILLTEEELVKNCYYIFDVVEFNIWWKIARAKCKLEEVVPVHEKYLNTYVKLVKTCQKYHIEPNWDSNYLNDRNILIHNRIVAKLNSIHNTVASRVGSLKGKYNTIANDILHILDADLLSINEYNPSYEGTEHLNEE